MSKDHPRDSLCVGVSMDHPWKGFCTVMRYTRQSSWIHRDSNAASPATSNKQRISNVSCYNYINIISTQTKWRRFQLAPAAASAALLSFSSFFPAKASDRIRQLHRGQGEETAELTAPFNVDLLDPSWTLIDPWELLVIEALHQRDLEIRLTASLVNDWSWQHWCSETES